MEYRVYNKIKKKFTYSMLMNKYSSIMIHDSKILDALLKNSNAYPDYVLDYGILFNTVDCMYSSDYVIYGGDLNYVTYEDTEFIMNNVKGNKKEVYNPTYDIRLLNWNIYEDSKYIRLHTTSDKNVVCIDENDSDFTYGKPYNYFPMDNSIMIYNDNYMPHFLDIRKYLNDKFILLSDFNIKKRKEQIIKILN